MKIESFRTLKAKRLELSSRERNAVSRLSLCDVIY